MTTGWIGRVISALPPAARRPTLNRRAEPRVKGRRLARRREDAGRSGVRVLFRRPVARGSGIVPLGSGVGAGAVRRPPGPVAAHGLGPGAANPALGFSRY